MIAARRNRPAAKGGIWGSGGFFNWPYERRAAQIRKRIRSMGSSDFDVTTCSCCGPREIWIKQKAAFEAGTRSKPPDGSEPPLTHKAHSEGCPNKKKKYQRKVMFEHFLSHVLVTRSFHFKVLGVRYCVSLVTALRIRLFHTCFQQPAQSPRTPISAVLHRNLIRIHKFFSWHVHVSRILKHVRSMCIHTSTLGSTYAHIHTVLMHSCMQRDKHLHKQIAFLPCFFAILVAAVIPVYW